MGAEGRASGGSVPPKRLRAQPLDVLRPGGWLVLETAAGSAADVAELLAGLGYVDVRRTKDLAGRDRVVEGSNPS